MNQGTIAAVTQPLTHRAQEPVRAGTRDDEPMKGAALVRRSRHIELADAYRIVSRIVPYIPPRWAYRLCERMEWVARLTPAWSNILTNLAYVVPHAPIVERERYARQVVSGLLKNYYDLLRSHALSSADMLRMTDERGLDNVRLALRSGKGAVVTIPHIGNISWIAEPMAITLGTRITVVVERMANPAVHDLINTLRRRSHVAMLEVGPQVARSLIRTLRNGEIVVLPADRTVAEATVEVPFFGATTRVPAGPAALALRTGAPLLTAYTYRQPNQRSIVVADPPLAMHEGERYDVARIMAAVMRVFETYVRHHPGQWLLTEPVWAN